MDRSAAQKGISELVARFETHIESYKDPNYKEARLRSEFINPLFEHLGWDVYNKNNYAEAYREVIQEDSLKIEGTLKAPDYSFRLVGGKRLFFVEAKKPSVSVVESVQPAYQVRRYGWSAKHPISVITDFEEFAIYDCTAKPNPNDKPSVARIKYLTFKDYIDEFDFLWNTFSKEQVLRGSFDKFISSDKHKQGTATVDNDFLTSLDRWRTYLAVNISWNNKLLGEEEINFVVQQLIDRIIFLRITEDRKIEPYGSLRSVLSYDDYYSSLFLLFRRADEKYNSGLFDFNRDRISETLKVENKVLRTIIDELYYPKCPYEFSVLPIEILGSAYEQFLGKVIRITPSHHAKVEEKPEVRKAGGVYYTPQYIVDYIVKNTVGKLIDGKTPDEISSLRIVDPACGSGSFLIGALHHLFEYHRNYYNKKGGSTKTKKDSPLTPDGQLTTSEKKRILLNNIYGVDLDANAVEVTKLSLLLKCLEGETDASINNQLKLFNERVLPSLDKNIKNGNSLIDTDYYDSHLIFGDEKKLKPFNWQSNFPEVFKHGGFDVAIGNPPYVYGRDWKSLGIGNDIKSYLVGHYKSLAYQLDFFSIFMEKSIQLINKDGFASFIVPNVWLTNKYSASTRKFLLTTAAYLKITVPIFKVFEGITVDTVIYVLRKGENQDISFSITKLGYSEESALAELVFADYIDGERPISTTLSIGGNTLVEKIIKGSISLDEIARITRGVHSYRIGGYGKSAFGSGQQTQRDVAERPYHSDKPILGYRPFIYGKDLKRFTKVKPREYIKYGSWLAEPREPQFFKDERIYSRKILGKALIVTVENEDTVADQQVYITKPNDDSVHVNYLAAILGSRLISFYIRNYFDEINDAFPQIKVGQLKSIPIKIGNQSDKSLLIELVSQLLKLNAEKTVALLPHQIEKIDSKIEYCENKINQIVYQIYGMTKEEVALIENSSK